MEDLVKLLEMALTKAKELQEENDTLKEAIESYKLKVWEAEKMAEHWKSVALGIEKKDH